MGEVSRRRFLLGALAGVGATAGASWLIALEDRAAGATGRPSGAAVGSSAAPAQVDVGLAAGAASELPGASPDTSAASPMASAPAPAYGFPRPTLVGTGRIASENRLPGSVDWLAPLSAPGGIEGYVDPVSVAPGGVASIHVRAPAGVSRIDVEVYRLGWYGSAGARLVASRRGVPVHRQPAPWRDHATGLVEPRWTVALSLAIPASWTSGLYVAVLAAGRARRWAPFVVREGLPSAPILVVSGVASSHAYNPWGGASLYGSGGAGAISFNHRARAVSLARPFRQGKGSGSLLRWEYPFTRWVEGAGFDVAYVADVDLELHPELLTGRRLVVLVGKPEYWSLPMRRALEAALATGSNLVSLAADEVYWRIRLEPGTGGPGRTIVCYKSAAEDPVAAVDPTAATVRWRDQPGADPESLLLGQQYAHICDPGDLVVADPGHWVYDRSGLRFGDRLPRLVGPEYDSVVVSPEMPAGVTVLARSPVVARSGEASGSRVIRGAPPQTATFYEAVSGASVFAAGTIQWSWGLDSWSWHAAKPGRARRIVDRPSDPRVGVITSNLLTRLGWRPGT